MNLLSTNKNIKLIKKVLGQDRDFSTTINYAKEIRETWTNMVNSTYKSIEDMINNCKV